MRDEACVRFLRWALPRLGLRWEGYRRVRRQVCRRLVGRLAELGLAGLEAYRDRLDREPGEWRVLERLCRVTVSRFFRDREVFERLRDEHLPRLAEVASAEGHRSLFAWSAGCASGEEPYSLAITWQLGVAPQHPDIGLHVLATDFDEHLLARARRGCYPPGTLREVPEEWRLRAFTPRDGELCLQPRFREGVELRLADLRRDTPDGPFDLILCRNLVLTYYEEPLQEELLRRFRTLLRPSGLLFVGRRERLPPGASEKFEPQGWGFFRRRAGQLGFRGASLW